MSIKINTIPCNIGSMDNYAYIITDLDTNICAIVDAAEEKTLINFCSNQNIVPQYVLSTHHHEDHTNANLALKKLYNLKIIGSDIEKNKIKGIDLPLFDNDTFYLGNTKIQAILTAGHTTGHMIWYLPDDKAVFTGDLLFNLTIGGIFEGTPQQMWQSLQKLKQLPDDTRFYPGHEYTHASLGYLTSQIDKPAFQQYLEFLQTTQPPVGNTLALEKRCNPYLQIQSETDFVNSMR